MATASGIRAGRAFVEFGVDNSQLAAGLRAAQAKLKMFGASLTSIGAGLMGFGASMAAPLLAAVTTFAGFEQTLARVRALLGLEKQSKAFKDLVGHARMLGETTVFSGSEAGQAMVQLALNGMKTNQILTATKPLMSLAAAGAVDLATAAMTAQEIMHQFNLEASDTGRIADMLASSMSSSATDVIGLREAFSYAGIKAGSLKMSIEETAAAIEILSNAGIKNTRAGTAIAGIMNSLLDPSRAPLLNRLGVQLADSKGDFRGLGVVLEDVHKSIANLGNVQRNSILGELFTNRQVDGMDKLVEKYAELQKITKRIESEFGKSEWMSNVQLDTLYGGWKLVTSAMEGVALSIGDALAPTIRGWGVAAVAGLTTLKDIVNANSSWLPVLAQTAVGVGAVGAGLVAAGFSVQVLAFAAGGLATAFGLLFSPTGWVLAGVTAFATLTDSGKMMVAGIAEDLKGIGETFSTAWTGIMDAVKAGSLETAGRIAWSGFQTVWAQGVKELYTSWSSFSGFFVDTWYKAIDLVAKGLVDAISTMSKAWIEASSWFDKDQEFWDRQARIMGVQARQIRGEITMAEREKQIAAIENEKSPAEERRQAALAAAENERKAWQGQLDQMAAEEKKRRDAARDAEIKRLDDNVKKSKEELAAAVAEADRMAKMAAWNKTGNWFGDFGEAGKGADQKKLQEAANRALAGGTTAGTFNAAAIRSLVGGGMDIPRQQLEEAKRQNDNLKKLRQDVQDNGLWFT